MYPLVLLQVGGRPERLLALLTLESLLRGMRQDVLLIQHLLEELSEAHFTLPFLPRV